ncbi:unnamed protein product [Parajaminaea phylloscopi]
MPKAPSSVARRRNGPSNGSGGASAAASSSSSAGPKFSSAAPTRDGQASLPSQLRQDDVNARFGSISQPGRRNKRKGKAQDGDAAEDDEMAPPNGVGSSSSSSSSAARPFVTGAKAGGGDKYVDKRLSSKILRLAREQQDEIEREEEEDGVRLSQAGQMAHRRRDGAGMMPDDDDDDDDDAAMGGRTRAMSDDDDGELDEAAASEEEFEYEEVEVDAEEAELLERMRADRMGADGQGDGAGGRRTLADLIMDKIEAAGASSGDGAAADGAPDEDGMVHGMNPKIVEVYTKVGELLSRYKSGPLPKAFKILPSLPHWEIVLSLTSPHLWTPHATLAATRIFVSNLKAAQSQRFFELVLREKFRDEIDEQKKTSYQIYEALKKGLYKPAAWFKGILFPLCEGGTLTLKESAILSSVLAKVSIPMLHSAAALLRLSEMEYSGPNSLFIRVLLDKKYALPYKVVDALVFHFLRFADPERGVEKLKDGSGGRRMPVLWHQSLLVFSQRYKQDLTPDQKTALLDLLRVQKHDGIGPEVRRELSTGKARGEMLDEPLGDDDDSDAMSV